MPNSALKANPTLLREVLEVTGGVDTHLDTHTVAALDQVGGLLGCTTFPATAAGYCALLAWLRSHGPLGRVGVEGTGSYGAGLARFLTGADITVIEVSRPNRADRRARGKSDPLDAENAARAVLAGTATGQPKARDGIVEAIRALHTTRRGAVKARTAAINQFAGLLVSAPEPLRAQLKPLSEAQRLATATAFRPGDLANPTQATKQALQRLARRINAFDTEIADTNSDLSDLTARAAPQLLAELGVGPDTAAQLLITAGDNPDRLATAASFAAVCGTSPVPASSGKTTRHRLNRGGDRQANRALHMILLTRLRHDPETRAYLERSINRGKSKRDAMRALKNYIARHLHRVLCDTVISPPLTT